MYLLVVFLSCRVGNHVGNQRYGDWNNFTKFNPFNQTQHFHSYCLITDFSNQQMVHKLWYEMVILYKSYHLSLPV